jgi:ssDNA-specific exonuclease RecJ
MNYADVVADADAVKLKELPVEVEQQQNSKVEQNPAAIYPAEQSEQQSKQLHHVQTLNVYQE